MDYFDKLLEDKKNGKTFDFDTITYDELKRLWYNECFPDSCIAILYDVKKSQVTSKRRKMEINQNNCILQDMINKIWTHRSINNINKS